MPSPPKANTPSRFKELRTKLDAWLAGTKSVGNLHLYEDAKKYCAEIVNDSDEYEVLISYLSQRIKI